MCFHRRSRWMEERSKERGSDRIRHLFDTESEWDVPTTPVVERDEPEPAAEEAEREEVPARA